MVSNPLNWQDNPVCPKCGSADIWQESAAGGDRMIVKGDLVCRSCDYRSLAEDAEWYPAESADED